MQGIAYLGKMNCSYMQGSIISEINFNSTNSFAVIGNNMHETNNKDDYESEIYMLDTSNGKFFTITKGNMLNMADSWSFNGR